MEERERERGTSKNYETVSLFSEFSINLCCAFFLLFIFCIFFSFDSENCSVRISITNSQTSDSFYQTKTLEIAFIINH